VLAGPQLFLPQDEIDQKAVTLEPEDDPLPAYTLLELQSQAHNCSLLTGTAAVCSEVLYPGNDKNKQRRKESHTTKPTDYAIDGISDKISTDHTIANALQRYKLAIYPADDTTDDNDGSYMAHTPHLQQQTPSLPHQPQS